MSVTQSRVQPGCPPKSLPFLAGMFVLLLMALLASCSTRAGRNNQADTVKTEKGTSSRDREYRAGDVRVEAGIEYIYVKNRKFGYSPYEPEYEWVRKDAYTPGIFEELADRIAKTSPASPPLKAESLPVPAPARLSAAVPVPVPAGSDSRLKRHVLMLPVKNETNPGMRRFDEFVLMRLESVLEYAGAVISSAPHDVDLTKERLTGETMEVLSTQGVQAIIRTVVEAPESAFLKVSLDIYDTETASLLRRLSARAPLERDMPEKELVGAVDHTMDLMKDELAKVVRSLDWYARVASLDKGGTVLNVGRLSGVREGDVMEVYGRGEKIVDRVTGQPLGRLKGTYKGEIEVFEIFGVDASWAKTLKGGPFLPADLVYLKK